MNKSLLKGVCIYSLGLTQELFGHLLGNNRLQVAGVHMQISGKCQIAVGDAQRIIRLCLNRQAKPVQMGMNRNTA